MEEPTGTTTHLEGLTLMFEMSAHSAKTACNLGREDLMFLAVVDVSSAKARIKSSGTALCNSQISRSAQSTKGQD